MYGQHTRLESEILNKRLSYHFFVESYTFFCIFCQARPRVSDCVFHAIPTQRHTTVTVGPGDEAELNAKADSTVRKYRASWLKWRSWATSKLAVPVIPAQAIHVALFVTGLERTAEEMSLGFSSIEGVVYGISGIISWLAYPNPQQIH